MCYETYELADCYSASKISDTGRRKDYEAAPNCKGKKWATNNELQDCGDGCKHKGVEIERRNVTWGGKLPTLDPETNMDYHDVIVKWCKPCLRFNGEKVEGQDQRTARVSRCENGNMLRSHKQEVDLWAHVISIDTKRTACFENEAAVYDGQDLSSMLAVSLFAPISVFPKPMFSVCITSFANNLDKSIKAVANTSEDAYHTTQPQEFKTRTTTCDSVHDSHQASKRHCHNRTADRTMSGSNYNSFWCPGKYPEGRSEETKDWTMSELCDKRFNRVVDTPTQGDNGRNLSKGKAPMYRWCRSCLVKNGQPLPIERVRSFQRVRE